MIRKQPADPQVADILVVDDTLENLELLSEMLKKNGYKVRPVTRGVPALQAAKSSPPDLILLHINMPDMSGYDVCQRLKADDALKGIPVIFISALGDAMDKVKAFQCGGVDYITKPFWMDEVMARVKTHLRVRQLQLELEKHNAGLEETVRARTREINEARDQLAEANQRLGILISSPSRSVKRSSLRKFAGCSASSMSITSQKAQASCRLPRKPGPPCRRTWPRFLRTWSSKSGTPPSPRITTSSWN